MFITVCILIWGTKSKKRGSGNNRVYRNLNNTEKDQNGLDEGTTSLGSKGIDKVASDIKTDLDSLYDGINVQMSDLGGGTEPKKSGTGSNNKTVHQYNKTSLRPSQ